MEQTSENKGPPNSTRQLYVAATALAHDLSVSDRGLQNAPCPHLAAERGGEHAAPVTMEGGIG